MPLSNCFEVMEHTFNISVYHTQEEIEKAKDFCDGGKYVDGLELLTGYTDVDPSLKDYVSSVHLPYSVDWYGPATGRITVDENMDLESVRYYHYGRDFDSIVSELTTAVKAAEPLDPAYGVLHAGSANLDELLCYDYSDKDEDVIEVFAEILNEVVSKFPGGEPPFTLALENTWWPGLRLTDSKGYKKLEEKLEFFDWGLCLDTGHLLFAMKGADDEASALDILNKCSDNYTEGLKSRLVAMHLHVNTSATILRNLADPDSASVPWDEKVKRAHHMIGNVDQHRPFTDRGVREYVDMLEPDYLVHEMGDIDMIDHIRNHICQRSFFD